MDFRYLIETKNEFNNFFCGIIVPHIYHGIRGMLKYSENVSVQIDLKIVLDVLIGLIIWLEHLSNHMYYF